MGLSLLKTLISNIIGSFIGNILLKVFMWIGIALVAHGGLIFAMDNINGTDTSFGTALGQAIKGDINFVMNNSENIIESTTSNIEDLKSVLSE